MRVTLVNMPWASIDFPSLALGLLKHRIMDEFPDSRVKVVHANLDFLDWITARAGLTREEYEFCWNSYFTGFSEWIFSSALYDDPRWRNDEFADLVLGTVPEAMLAKGRTLHALAPEYVAGLVGGILADEPDVVGFSTTFAQNSAVLATARLLKERAPDLPVVLGGGNCDGPQGAVLHRAFPFLDYVCRGEGEVAITRLLACLRDGGDPSGIPGLCWRDRHGTAHVNPMSAAPLPPAALVTPDYTDYFEQHAASRAGALAEPHLVVESSRGCWWGQKHHCTFCGLNGSFMEFRSKSPHHFVAELTELSRRHRVLNVAVADNILDMAYLRSAVPELAAAGHDLRISYEIKSNLRREQLAGLVEAGVHYVQPGIESLSARVLRLMDKGVTGCQNVRMLRDAQSVGLGVVWNYLHGFPGESEADYDTVIRQLPALTHLAPPSDVTRIAVERFSPYFNRPELGFGDLRPAAYYGVVYDLPEADLYDMAYVFDARHQGVTAACAGRLEKAVDAWRDGHARGRLTQVDLGDRVVLTDTRPGHGPRHHTVEDWELAAFRLLAQPHTTAALTAKVRAAGHAVGDDETARCLARWRDDRLLFTDGGQFVHVVPDAANQDLRRWVTAPGAPAPVPALLTDDLPRPAPGAADALRCWRERDASSCAVPGMRLPDVPHEATPAATLARLTALGVRHVALPGPVLLTRDAGRAVRDLALVRELTGHGISVDWDVDLGPDTEQWRLLGHLHPPRGVHGPDGDAVAAQWRAAYHPNKCGYRRGDGFIEINDHRFGTQRRLVLGNPNQRKLTALMAGTPADGFRPGELEAFLAAGLVQRVGTLLWWLPTRIVRWPSVT